MKYDIDINPDDNNTSHAVIVELVGSGRRVLDVGCSTGYLARRLQERGNVVVGVEIDEAAAAQAGAWTESVVVGNLEQLDLGETFGPEQFDVVVFADVLEHLTDPLGVLRQAPAVLRPGGEVIVSIPNVAHGAVRLALLAGQFDYRPLGLLDNTHLRFFTRQTVEDLLRGAGLVAVERRRTEAGVFATEIGLDPRRYPPGLLEEVEADPDSATYQFVVRAIPVDDGVAARTLATELAAREQELLGLCQLVEAMVRAAPGFGDGPAVAVLSAGPAPAHPTDGADAAGRSDPETLLDALRGQAVAGELRRRLGGYALRLYAATDQPSTAWTGDPVHPLLPWSEERAAQMVAAVDAVVVTGPAPAEAVTDDLGRRGAPVLWVHPVADKPPPGATDAAAATRLVVGGPPSSARSGPETPGPERFVPDVLVLAGRLPGSHLLDRRAAYLRMLGHLPPSGPYVVACLSGGPSSASEAVARYLDELARRASASIVVLGQPGQARPDYADRLTVGHRWWAPVDAYDLLAAIAQSDSGVTDSAGIVALGLGLGRPYQALSETRDDRLIALADWLGDPDLIAEKPAGLLEGAEAARARAGDTRRNRGLAEALDLAFDDLAGDVRAHLARRAARTVPAKVVALAERVSILEAANAGLQQRMAQERAAFGARAASLTVGSESEHEAGGLLGDLRTELHLRRAQYEHLERELARLYNTKAMRYLQPARKVYGRLRRLRP